MHNSASLEGSSVQGNKLPVRPQTDVQQVKKSSQKAQSQEDVSGLGAAEQSKVVQLQSEDLRDGQSVKQGLKASAEDLTSGPAEQA